MLLWIYTPYEHVRTGVIDSPDGLEITNRSIKTGELAFTVPLDESTRAIRTDCLIWPQGDRTAYIVTTCIKDTQSNGQETISVRAWCLKWILTKRAFPVSKIFKGKSGAVLHQILTAMNTETKKQFPRFSWSIDAALGDDITLEATEGEYADTFEAVCEASGLVMEALFDSVTRQVVMQVTKGADRSIGNTEGRVPVLLDESLETVEGIAFTESIADAKNVMYITDAAGLITEVGATSSTGYARSEARMADSGGKTVTNADGSTTTLTTAQYAQKKTEAAQKELAKLAAVKSATGTVPQGTKLLTFGSDFMLGDIVTVRKASWGTQVNVRIIADTRREKNGAVVRTLTIGSPLPTIGERIKSLK